MRSEGIPTNIILLEESKIQTLNDYIHNNNTQLDFIYIAIGSAIHEINDFSQFQSFPRFLEQFPSKRILIILYDNFNDILKKSSYNNYILEKARLFPNITFFIMSTYEEGYIENLIRNNSQVVSANRNPYIIRNIVRLKNLHNFMISVISEINKHRRFDNSWVLCNYINFREPNHIEQLFLIENNRFIEELLPIRTYDNVKNNIFNWSYNNEIILFSEKDKRQKINIGKMLDISELNLTNIINANEVRGGYKNKSEINKNTNTISKRKKYK